MKDESAERMRYRKVSAKKYMSETDRFIVQHGDDKHGIISDEEFDRLFDIVQIGLNRIGTFNGDGRFGNEVDFSSSRYVDQLPFISVVVNRKVSISKLIEASQDIVKTAHRPFCLAYDFETNYLAVFPDGSVMGTLTEDSLKDENQPNQ